MSQTQMFLLVFLLAGTILPAVWLGVTFLLSRAAGWHLLARAYPEREPFTGRRLDVFAATVRGISYNSCLTLGVAPQGLHVSVLLPFRPANRPLLIPWTEITASPATRFFMQVVRLDFRSVPSVSMTISKSSGDRLLAAAPASLSRG